MLQPVQRLFNLLKSPLELQGLLMPPAGGLLHAGGQGLKPLQRQSDCIEAGLSLTDITTPSQQMRGSGAPASRPRLRVPPYGVLSQRLPHPGTTRPISAAAA